MLVIVKTGAYGATDTDEAESARQIGIGFGQIFRCAAIGVCVGRYLDYYRVYVQGELYLFYESSIMELE